MKKTISLLLVFVMLLSFLTSCGKDFAKRRDKAESLLGKKPYVIEVEIDYHCDNAEMTAMFDELEHNKTTVYSKNGDYKIVNTLDIKAGDSDNKLDTVYTVIDGKVYCNVTYALDSIVSNIYKYYSEINGEQTRTLLNNMCLFGGVTLDGFANVSEYNDEEELVTVYSTATGENVIALEKMLSSQLEGTGTNISLTSSRLTVELDGNRYDSATMECGYNVDIANKTYSVTLSVELEFDYDEAFSIDLPSDHASYTKNDIENIIG